MARQGHVPFSPKIAGIKPGTFTGKVTVVNKQTAQAPSSAAAIAVSYDMCRRRSSASILQRPRSPVRIRHAAAFVGGEAGRR